MEWHGGQFTALYSLGSSSFAGVDVDKEVLEAAIEELDHRLGTVTMSVLHMGEAQALLVEIQAVLGGDDDMQDTAADAILELRAAAGEPDEEEPDPGPGLVMDLEGKTNITPEVRDAFNALVSGEFNNFALFSCWVNGEPTSVISVVSEEPGGDYVVQPLFAAITPGMQLVDHDGEEPTEGGSRKPEDRPLKLYVIETSEKFWVTAYSPKQAVAIAEDDAVFDSFPEGEDFVVRCLTQKEAEGLVFSEDGEEKRSMWEEFQLQSKPGVMAAMVY